jgi:hypothetical protein
MVEPSCAEPSLACPAAGQAISCTKGKELKIEHAGLCQQLARALRDLLARYRDLHLQRLTIRTPKSVYQNLIMGQSYGL